jgi:hypothetical protein
VEVKVFAVGTNISVPSIGLWNCWRAHLIEQRPCLSPWYSRRESVFRGDG